MKRFLITVDIEEDISPYLSNSYKGVEEGLPRLLDLLEKLDIKADFFVTADVCVKYPRIIERIVEEGYGLGCHGYKHETLWFKTYGRQLKELTNATKIIEDITGERPIMFRAPRFSVNSRTIKALEKLEYEIDSSVLPDNVTKIFKGFFTIQSFVGAPRTPYHPSYKNVIKEGDATIMEVPLTENPLFRGAPVGVGFLNNYGVEKTVNAIDKVEQDYVTFLIHPWELVNLGRYYPKLRKWVHDICSDDLEPLQELFEYINKLYVFSTITELTCSPMR